MKLTCVFPYVKKTENGVTELEDHRCPNTPTRMVSVDIAGVATMNNTVCDECYDAAKKASAEIALLTKGVPNE